MPAIIIIILIIITAFCANMNEEKKTLIKLTVKLILFSYLPFNMIGRSSKLKESWEMLKKCKFH